MIDLNYFSLIACLIAMTSCYRHIERRLVWFRRISLSVWLLAIGCILLGWRTASIVFLYLGVAVMALHIWNRHRSAAGKRRD